MAESGIGGHADVKRLAVHGLDTVLVGESLMRQADVAAATRSLIFGMGGGDGEGKEGVRRLSA